MSTVPEFRLPTSFGAYRLLLVLGGGGMGWVARARHRFEPIATRQGGDVALKLMHRDIAGDPVLRARFEQEAELGMTLDHPRIARALDLEEDSGQVAIVMELIRGAPLLSFQRRPLGEVLTLVAQIAEALDHAHRRWVVHRDLKPGNVMIGPHGAVLLDFGVARYGLGLGTMRGSAMGTWAYMAPEQAEDAKGVGPAADLYSLALLAYEQLSGALPWPIDATDRQIDAMKVSESLRPLREVAPEVPPKVADVIQWGLRARPKERPPGVEAFARALADAAGVRLRLLAPPAPARSTPLPRALTPPVALERHMLCGGADLP